MWPPTECDDLISLSVSANGGCEFSFYMKDTWDLPEKNKV